MKKKPYNIDIVTNNTKISRGFFLYLNSQKVCANDKNEKSLLDFSWLQQLKIKGAHHHYHVLFPIWEMRP